MSEYLHLIQINNKNYYSPIEEPMVLDHDSFYKIEFNVFLQKNNENSNFLILKIDQNFDSEKVLNTLDQEEILDLTNYLEIVGFIDKTIFNALKKRGLLVLTKNKINGFYKNNKLNQRKRIIKTKMKKNFNKRQSYGSR